MATQKVINLYNRYLKENNKAGSAAILLNRYPELAKETKEEKPKEAKKDGKKSKR